MADDTDKGKTPKSTKRKGGRPSRAESEEIRNNIRFYFEKNINASTCQRKTGYNMRTVRAYYNEWTEQLIANHNKEFGTMQKDEIERSLNAMDQQVLELISIQNQIGTKVAFAVKQAEAQKRTLSDDEIRAEIRMNLAKSIFDLTDKKTALAITPNTAQTVTEEVKRILDQYKNQSE